MRRSLLILVAAFAWMAACSDTSRQASPTAPGSHPLATEPTRATVTGHILVSGSGDDRAIELATGDGQRYLLVGSEASRLASVDGGDVLIRGTFDAAPGLVVDEFEVTGMHGRPALDGVLETDVVGFVLRLRDGSTWRWPADIAGAAPVGARVWVIGSEEDPPIEYGVIADQ